MLLYEIKFVLPFGLYHPSFQSGCHVLLKEEFVKNYISVEGFSCEE